MDVNFIENSFWKILFYAKKMKMMIKNVFKSYLKSFEIIEKNSSKVTPGLEIL